MASRSHVTAHPVPPVPGPPLPRTVERALTFAVLLAARRGTSARRRYLLLGLVVTPALLLFIAVDLRALLG